MIFFRQLAERSQNTLLSPERADALVEAAGDVGLAVGPELGHFSLQLFVMVVTDEDLGPSVLGDGAGAGGYEGGRGEGKETGDTHVGGCDEVL
ncbi:hypothetical protein ColLi_02650 [Colletotrichum liriopes]|uniref:Uncharacterized protein n=1 Tax=Colletotrichum liriopes TaxID=708192 RepID=A0AA37LPX9_9PEZI|nr:hypothetical protein ColLi_02650 [Colletotrichum liriopes]